MWLYTSSLTIMGASVLSFLVLVWLVAGRNALNVLRGAVQNREGRFLLLIGGMFALLWVDKLETGLEPLIDRVITWDFTQAVTGVGTGVIRLVQQLEWSPLTHGLTYVYVILFPVLPMVSMLLYTSRRDWSALLRLFTAFTLNYVAALPFYILVPVKEAWAAQVGIRFLIPMIFPGFENYYRQFSGLDNCFPSSHTSLALTGALVAWRCGYRRLAIVLGIGSGLVMFSTLYLGVHSVLDMVAGIILAVVITAPLQMSASKDLRSNLTM